MPGKALPTLLADVLHRYANVNAFTADWPNKLKAELFDPRFPERAPLLRRQLAEAILEQTITPAEYERLTGEDFDSQDELDEWLREFWRAIFGNETIPPS